MTDVQNTRGTEMRHLADEQLRPLLDEYLRMYAGRDDRLTTRFSENFTGITGGGDFLCKDQAHWVDITRLDFSQVKDALRLELKDYFLQPLSESVAIITSFFFIHLPLKESILSREIARLVLVYRKESDGWKICHSSISIPYPAVQPGEVYPLKNLTARNAAMEELLAEKAPELSTFAEHLRQANAALAHEISERKLAEEARARLEVQNRMLEKSESLRRMAGAIAHLYNNQLMGVMGNLDLAATTVPAQSDTATYLAGAMAALRRATEVGNLMLTYLGQVVSKRELHDLAEVCRENSSIYHTVMPKQVFLATHLPDPGPSIRADVTQIRDVLANLIINAWESYGEERGVVRLTVKTEDAAAIPERHRFPVDWQPQDAGYACLEVADKGCGIPASVMEKLFDPFFSTKFPGRGMGLAVVLGIVQALDGGITVESKQGQGSTFRVYLPRAKPKA